MGESMTIYYLPTDPYNYKYNYNYYIIARLDGRSTYITSTTTATDIATEEEAETDHLAGKK